MNPMPRPRLNSSPFRCCRAVMSLAVLLAAAFCAGGAPAGAGDASVQKRIEAILERRLSFKTEEEARPTLKELDDASNNPNLERELRYRAAHASYKVKSYLFLYKEAHTSARTALDFAANADERAKAALAVALTLLWEPKIAKDESEVRSGCENALTALDKYIEFAKQNIPITKTVHGEKIEVCFDPHNHIFMHILVLSLFSDYLSSVNDHEGAWKKTADALTMAHTYPEYIPKHEVDPLYSQHFENSMASGNYHTAATLVLRAFKHETMSEKVATRMLDRLAQQMVKAGKLTASDVFPSELPLKDDPMIAFLFKSIVAFEFHRQEKFSDAIELIKHNLDYVSTRMKEAADTNNKELLEEMKKTQYEMLGLLNSCYTNIGNYDAALSIGGIMKLLQADRKDSPGSEKDKKH